MLPGDVALGFSVLPRCAAVFNDNMVAPAVAAPLRKCEGEVGRGGEGRGVGEYLTKMSQKCFADVFPCCFEILFDTY